jgi:hypothetical protein
LDGMIAALGRLAVLSVRPRVPGSRSRE